MRAILAVLVVSIVFLVFLEGLLVLVMAGQHYHRRATASCVTGNGGYVDDAAYACSRFPPQALSGVYISADTLALGIPGMCVTPQAQFYFHSARIDGTFQIGNEGNQVMAETWGRWPRLLSYLERKGVFKSFELIHLTGLDLGRLGVPMCRR